MDFPYEFVWDARGLGEVLGLNATDLRAYFTDGRRVSFLIERRLRDLNPGWRLAASEGAAHDLIDATGGMWEVRSITANGVYFSPSGDVGSGRSFDDGRFRKKLVGMQGFLLADIVDFPKVVVFRVMKGDVLRWYVTGVLTKRASTTRGKFYGTLLPDIRLPRRK